MTKQADSDIPAGRDRPAVIPLVLEIESAIAAWDNGGEQTYRELAIDIVNLVTGEGVTDREHVLVRPEA